MQFYADEQFNVEGTDTIIMLHNVVLHHNGAVVVCDSAVRYSENRFECFGDVIINQDSTYIYCQRATYDRLENTAQVFDDLIKIVSGSSELYTYNFSFNTLDNVGRYWGGGTMLQDSNRMESERGWYHTDTKDIYAAGGVQMTDPDYKLISDSVRYNTGEQVAEFYTLTYIWNSDNDMLSATKGLYYNRTREYDFTADAFVMTETQQLWADSLRYSTLTRDAVAHRNIQILDEENQTMAFGDYGEWYGGPQEGLLTLEPSLVGFDRDAPEDTVYMRSDSIFIFSIPWDAEWDALPEDSTALAETPVPEPEIAEVIEEVDILMPPLDSAIVADTLMLPVIPVDTLMVNMPQDSAYVADSIPELEPEHDSLQRMIKAYRNVKIWRHDLQAVCDSMVAFSKDSTAHMYIDPVIWNEENQITSTVVDIYTRDKELYRAEFTGDPIMISKVYGEQYNQIKGRRMESFFRDNEVERHFVDGNAQTHYYEVGEGEARPHTFAIVNSATATFWFREQEAIRMTFSNSPDYVAYPIDQIPNDVEEYLPGFKWEAERRPVRADVFTRTIKPDRRTLYSSIPQPQFPLTQKIEAHKGQLIGSRQWEERYELLPLAAIEWLRRIGVRQ